MGAGGDAPDGPREIAPLGETRHVAGGAAAERRQQMPLGGQRRDEDHLSRGRSLVDRPRDLELARAEQRRSHDQHPRLAARDQADDVRAAGRVAHDPKILLALEQITQTFPTEMLVVGKCDPDDAWRRSIVRG